MQKPRYNAPIEQKTYEVSDELAAAASKPSILLLDDEKDYGETIKLLLDQEGYDVTIATDGVQGLKRVMEKDYDVVICDMMMPNLPGDMFFMAVERVKPLLTKRFIFITGHSGLPRITDFLKRVRGLTLFKPFQTDQLFEMIQAVLRKNRPPGS